MHLRKKWKDMSRLISNRRASSSEPILLTNLPLELLTRIYALSLNVCLLQVNHEVNRVLDTPSARLQFCLEAFHPAVDKRVGAGQAARLQNGLLRQPWLDLDYARRIESVLNRRRGCENDDRLLNAAGSCVTVVANVHIPAKLLKPPWTDDRIDYFTLLLRWKATILTTYPICHLIPERLLRSAVFEHNLRAVNFCRKEVGVAYTQDTLRLAVLNGCNKDIVGAIIIDRFQGGQNFIEWQDEILAAWVREKTESKDPDGFWLMKALATEGYSIWDPIQEGRRRLEQDKALES